MTPTDLGLLAFAVLAWVVVAIGALVSRAFAHDEMFADVPPGVIPARPEDAPTYRLRGVTREYAGEVAVAFSPPRGVRPGLLGTIVDGSVDSHDLTATLVDLAVRGHLTISAVPSEGRPSADRKLYARRPEEEQPKTDWVLTASAGDPGDPLSPAEAHLLAGIFSAGGAVRMSQLDRTALQALRDTQASFYADAVGRGWYRRHPRQQGGVGCLPIVIGVVVGGLFVAASGVSIPGIAAGALVLVAAIAFARVTRRRTARTALGSAVRIQGLGFKQYLATAEAGQFAFEEAAGIFSRYLPYAMALGVAQHWAKVFGDVAKEASASGVGGDLVSDLLWFNLADGFSDLLFFDSLDGDFDMLAGATEAIGGLAGAATDGLGDAATGLGDFLGSLDFLDGLGDGCGDFDGCGDG